MTKPDPAAPYGLHRPTMDDAHDAVPRVHGAPGPHIWTQLLRTAGLSGREADPHAIERLLEAMRTADPVSRLCAHALRIRLASHTHLTAAHAMTRSNS